MEEGVVGAVLAAVAFCWAIYRSGEDGRRTRVKLAEGGRPRIGELLRSGALGV
jgi:hypothetical protein